jgi:hypothetical protein
MNSITIHQTALHAALVELRDRGGEREDNAEAAAFLIDGLNVLARLFDPYAAIAAATRAAGLPEGRARKLKDGIAAAAAEARVIGEATAGPEHSPEAGTPAPPTITTTAGPGPSAQADGGGAPTMEEAASPPLTPAPAQAAGGNVPRKRAKAPSVWMPEREKLLHDRYPTEGATPRFLDDLNALPGEQITSLKAITRAAVDRGIRITPDAKRAKGAANAEKARAAKVAAVGALPSDPERAAESAPPAKPRQLPSVALRRPDPPLPPPHKFEATDDYDPKQLDPLDNGLREPAAVTTARGLLREGYGEAYVVKLSRLPAHQVRELAEAIRAERLKPAADASRGEGAPA